MNKLISSKSLKYLICDDSDYIRMMLAVVVRLLDGEVTGSATDGVECIRMYKESQPDILLLDIMMPGMSGFEVIKEIMRYDREARVIIVSCLANQEAVIESMALGAKYFLAKPFKPVEAAKMVREQIEKWSLE